MKCKQLTQTSDKIEFIVTCDNVKEAVEFIKKMDYKVTNINMG